MLLNIIFKKSKLFIANRNLSSMIDLIIKGKTKDRKKRFNFFKRIKFNRKPDYRKYSKINPFIEGYLKSVAKHKASMKKLPYKLRRNLKNPFSKKNKKKLNKTVGRILNLYLGCIKINTTSSGFIINVTYYLDRSRCSRLVLYAFYRRLYRGITILSK